MKTKPVEKSGRSPEEAMDAALSEALLALPVVEMRASLRTQQKRAARVAFVDAHEAKRQGWRAWLEPAIAIAASWGYVGWALVTIAR